MTKRKYRTPGDRRQSNYCVTAVTEDAVLIYINNEISAKFVVFT
jgi:hypothetical protein